MYKILEIFLVSLLIIGSYCIGSLVGSHREKYSILNYIYEKYNEFTIKAGNEFPKFAAKQDSKYIEHQHKADSLIEMHSEIEQDHHI